MGSLLEAVESRISRQEQQQEILELKRAVVHMREEVWSIINDSLEQMRYRLSSTFQKMRVELLGKVDASSHHLSHSRPPRVADAVADDANQSAVCEPLSRSASSPRVISASSVEKAEQLVERLRSTCEMEFEHTKEAIVRKVAHQERKIDRQYDALKQSVSSLPDKAVAAAKSPPT